MLLQVSSLNAMGIRSYWQLPALKELERTIKEVNLFIQVRSFNPSWGVRKGVESIIYLYSCDVRGAFQYILDIVICVHEGDYSQTIMNAGKCKKK